MSTTLVLLGNGYVMVPGVWPITLQNTGLKRQLRNLKKVIYERNTEIKERKDPQQKQQMP